MLTRGKLIFFDEAKNLYENEKYEDSKFLFQRNIVYNPKDSKSYLYLAKIFKNEENKTELEKNINTVFTNSSQTTKRQCILFNRLLSLERSNFSKAEELREDFKKICSNLCDKIASINKRLKEFEKKMRLENNLDKILIIDFGSQFTQLIARKVRELNVFCEIISHNKLKDYKNEKNVKGIILSGGPLNVYQNKKLNSIKVY